ncbi:MAG: hypothetical protein AB7S38_10090 [Vulcanimicrobiota bacterium]
MNLSKGEQVETRTNLLARSALAEFIGQVREFDESRTFNLLDPQASLLATQFEGHPLIERPDEFCDITFVASADGFSTDNTSSDLPRAGWLDRGSSDRSVPPYTLELILRARYRNTTHYYRALLRRVWPYAVYSAAGPIVLMGIPQDSPLAFPNPSHVKGAVYTNWNAGGSGGGGPSSPTTALDKLIESEVAAAGVPQGTSVSPVIVGPRVVTQPITPPAELTVGGGTAGAKYLTFSGTGGTAVFGSVDVIDQSNLLEGDIHYHHSLGLSFNPWLGASMPGFTPNQVSGNAIRERDMAVNPLADLSAPDPSGFTLVSPHLVDLDIDTALGIPPTELVDDFRSNSPLDPGDPPELLAETLALNASGAATPHYRYVGNLRNRQAFELQTDIPSQNLYSGTLMIQEMAAGLRLQDCVLYIEGDLDLGASSNPVEIYGNNATLIVNGRLTLANGTIDAGDQGFVLYAHDIMMKAGGTYRGLIVAENTISIVPGEGDRLIIEGGLMAGGAGGITLRSVEVNHNPKYLKMVNGAGDFNVIGWQKLR